MARSGWQEGYSAALVAEIISPMRETVQVSGGAMMPYRITGGVFVFVTGAILIFMMVAYPMVYSLLYIKAALFGVLLCVALTRILLAHTIRVNRQVFCWTLVLCMVAAGYFVEGAFHSLLYAYREGEVYFLWPLVYVLLLSLIKTRRDLQLVFGILIFTSIFVGVYGLWYALQTFGVIPEAGFINALALGDKQAVGIHGDYVQVLVANLNSLPFLFPFVLSLIYVGDNNSGLCGSRTWIWLSFVLQLALILISGRRALWVLVVVTPVILFFVASVMRQVNRQFVVYVIALMVFIVGIGGGLSVLKFGFNFDDVYHILADAFEFGAVSGASNVNRAHQFVALVNGWWDAPLFGHGFGTFPLSYIRAPDMPWSYELYYVALLFHVGIVGVLIYFAAVIWLVWKAIRISRRHVGSSSFILPALMGLIGTLIATATNPYLDRFDGIWVIFVVAAAISVFDTGVEAQRGYRVDYFCPMEGQF